MTANNDSLLLIVADGVRPDVLQKVMNRGDLPHLAEIALKGSFSKITSCFPSVTGPAYAPFLTGRFPSAAGLPGLRWYDRSRSIAGWPGYSRSYAGAQIHKLDHDLNKKVDTLLEIVKPSVAGGTILGRGARGRFHPGRGLSWAARAFIPHFRGDFQGWRKLEQLIADRVLSLLKTEQPRFAVMSFVTPDKLAHIHGAHSTEVEQSLKDIDNFAQAALKIASQQKRSEKFHIWLVADHGHANVHHHDELSEVVRKAGFSVLAHPRIWSRKPEVAVMVGGNAMAHIYLNPNERKRSWWNKLQKNWQELHKHLVERKSIDIVACALSPETVSVHSYSRGSARIQLLESNQKFSYLRDSGDPLGLERDLENITSEEAHEACSCTDYPDSIVQLASLVPDMKSGDIIVSASEGWDLRKRYEPIPHRSTHGGLHKDQMLVPLITDSIPTGTARRTADVMPSILAQLGMPLPPDLDGKSFIF